MDSLAAVLHIKALQGPDAIALVDGSRRLTYAKLYALAMGTAQNLRKRGLLPGERVATVMQNSVESVALIYGTWLAGGIIVPLNPQARGHDVCSLAQHAGARLLVPDPDFRDLNAVMSAMHGSDVEVVSAQDLCRDDSTPLAEPCINGPASLAMLLYTSGTTGHPKAVMLSHGNISANTAAIISYLELTSHDSVLSVLPFNYSYGSSVLHTHLAAGGTIVLQKNLVFPHAIVETMARENVTGFSGVPSTFALLLSRVNFSETKLDSLRYVTQAGAAMPVTLIGKLRTALPTASIFVMYGQTEATARLSYVPPARLADKPGAAGIPVPGVDLSIRDEHGRTLQAFATGEIWARGPNIMQGYWRDEAASREVLIDGWLKTGDIGYLDDEGYLFLAGRRSDIIKTGAHRIHPVEIEEAIAGMPGVREVAVAGIDDDILGQAVAAYIVAAPENAPSVDQIKAHCRSLLATYKIPKQVHIVPALPRTSSGKVQRAELSSMATKELT